MTSDDYKKKKKLPPVWRSKLYLFFLNNTLWIGLIIYLAIFLLWPLLKDPEPVYEPVPILELL